jgi:hypothetical protein
MHRTAKGQVKIRRRTDRLQTLEERKCERALGYIVVACLGQIMRVARVIRIDAKVDGSANSPAMALHEKRKSATCLDLELSKTAQYVIVEM